MNQSKFKDIMYEIYDKIINLKSNKFWSKLIYNMILSFSGDTISSVLNVIVVFVIIKLIGDYQYGVMVLAISYMMIVDSLVNFQSWQAVIKYGTEALSLKDYDSLAGIVKFGTIVDLISAVLGMIIALFALPIIAAMMGWSDELVLIASLFSIEIAFHFSGTPIGILRLLNKFKMVAIQKIISATIRFIAVGIYFFFLEKTLLSLVVVYVISNIIGHILLTTMAFYQINKLLSIKKIIHSKLSYKRNEFFKFVAYTNITSSIDIPVKQFDVFIISKVSYEMVAVYKVFKQVVDILGRLTSPLSQAIMPQFSELISNNEYKEGYNVVLKLRNLILFIMIPISIVVTVISPYFLNIFLGDLYAKKFYILSIYLIVKSISLSYAALHPYFVALGLVKDTFGIVLIANVIYIILALVLTNYIGVIGMILAYFAEFMIVIILKTKVIKDKKFIT